MGTEQAEEGWQYFDTLKDAYGGISLATFQEQVQKALSRAIKETNAPAMLSSQVSQGVGSMAGSVSDFDARVTKVTSKLIQKLLNSTPVFATAVFRLFDIDSSGSISRQEVIAFAQIAKSAMEMAGNDMGSSSKKNPVMTGRKILASVFRVFDENNNGNIEAIELSNIISSWIVTVMNLGTDVVVLFEDLIKSDAVKKAALEIGMGLRSVTQADDSGTINVDQTLTNLLDSMPNEAPQELASSLTGGFTNVKEELKELIPDMDDRTKKAMDKFNALLEKVNSDAEKAEISKESMVSQATVVFCEIIELFLSVDVMARSMNRPLDLFNGMLVESTPITEGISQQLSAELLDSFVSHLRLFFRGGGLNQTLQTLFDVIDVNNNQKLSKSELTNLGNMLSLMTQDWTGSGLRNKFADVIKAYLKLIDENSDGTLSSEEIQIFVGKLVDFAFAIQFLLIFALKEAALAVLLPAVRIGLDLKTQVVGGSTDSITEADVMCLFAVIGMSSM
jgi:Ca2+-binding EF-hand superfamily protein